MAVPLGISTVICFIPFNDPNSIFYNQTLAEKPMLLFVLAIILYLVYCTMYTAMNIPFGSLASVITDDPKGRTLLSTFRSIGSGIGGAVVLFLAPMFIYNNVTVNGKEVQEADGNKMFIFGLAMGVLSLVFYLWGYKSTKERVPSEPDPKIDFKATYLGLLKSRPFVTVALAGVLISGQLQFGSFNAYLYKNYFENTNLSMLGTVCTYLPTVILLPFIGKLSAKYGKKELCGKATIVSAIGAVALAIVANNQSFLDMIDPINGRLPWPVFMITLFIIGMGYTFVSLTCWAVVMDVIDYQEYATGIRNESAVYAVYTFSRKLGQTIADTLGLYLLQWAKYDKDVAGIGFIEQNDTSKKIMFICTIIPAVVYTGVWLLMRFGYPLTKEKLDPVYTFIREKREAAALEAAE